MGISMTKKPNNTEIKCKKYLQIFVLLFTSGFGLLISILNWVINNNVFNYIVIVLIACACELLLGSIWSIIRVKELQNILGEQMRFRQLELESLK